MEGGEYHKNMEDDPYVIMLVTAYSEGKAGLKGTIESLASTNYPDHKKLIVLIADGS